MPYVMVPVPEDLVEEVMQFILRTMTRAALEPWDAEALGRLFEDVDELSRALLSFVARAVVDGQQLTEVEAAKMVQLTGREMLAIQRELNDLAREAGRPPLIQHRTLDVVQPSGRTAEERILTMDDDVAELVSEAERAELVNEQALRAERSGGEGG